MTDQTNPSETIEIASTVHDPEDVRNAAADTLGPTSNPPPTWVDPARNHGDDDSLMLRTAILQPSADIMALAAKRDSRSTDEPCLIVQSGRAQGTTINLLPVDKETPSTWIIGCEADCDILLNEVGISAFHAIVAHDGGQWTLADQQSASGTFVNGKPCLKRVLQDGDQLQFGRVKSTFHVPKQYRTRPTNRTERLLLAVKALFRSS